MKIDGINPRKLQTLRPYLILVPLLMLVVAGIFWYQERTLFVDNALQTFLMINDGSIKVMADRYPSVLIRFLPLIAIKLGANLDFVLVLFSMSYALYHLVIGIILIRWKAWQELATLLVVHVVLKKHAFFWTPSELLQVMSFFLLTLAYLRRTEFKVNVIGVLLLVICILYHPQSLFLLLFGLAYYFTKTRMAKITSYIALLLAFVLTKIKLFSNWYDTMKFEQLSNSYKRHDLRFWEMESWAVMREFSLFQMIVVGAIILIALRILISKEWIKAVLGFGVLLVSVLLFHYQNDSSLPICYAEPSYLAAMLPLVYLVMGTKLKRTHLWTAATIVFVMSLVDLSATSSRYSSRLDFVHSTLSNIKHEKSYMKLDDETKEQLIYHWGLGFESLLLSAKDSDLPIKTLVSEYDYRRQEQEYLAQPDRRKAFATGLGVVYVLEDTRYFDFEEDRYLGGEK